MQSITEFLGKRLKKEGPKSCEVGETKKNLRCVLPEALWPLMELTLRYHFHFYCQLAGIVGLATSISLHGFTVLVHFYDYFINCHAFCDAFMLDVKVHIYSATTCMAPFFLKEVGEK